VQKIIARIAEIDKNEFDLIAFDEAHHHPAKSWETIGSHLDQAKIIFLIATPFRSDGKIVHFKDPIYRFTYSDARQKNMIKEFRTIYEDDENSVIKKILSILKFLDQQEGGIPNQKAIVYTKKRAQEIKTLFTACDEYLLRDDQISIIDVHQGSADVRKNLTEGFKMKAEIRIAIVNKMLCEGFDCPLIGIAAIMDKYSVRLNIEDEIKGKRSKAHKD